MMEYSLTQFSQDIRNANYQCLSVDLSVNGFRIAALQRELQGMGDKTEPVDDKALEEYIESQNFRFLGKGWTRFNMMAVTFLQYCRDVNPWSLWESCDLIFGFYQNLGNCLLNDNYPIDPLAPLFKEMTEYVIPIAIQLDDNYMSLNTRKNQFLSHASSIISKVFNSVKPLRVNDDDIQDGAGTELPGKQSILLYLVNKLSNIYFRIESPQLCSNVFKNFRPKSMISSFSQYPIKEQVEYRYLLGRYYLLNNRVTNAFLQLNTAYKELSLIASTADLSQTPQIKRNLIRIMRYLVPTGLMLGKMPRFQLISQIDNQLSLKYYSLFQCIRAGNIKALNLWLKGHERALCQDRLLLILLEKLPMICYRYLVKTVLRSCVLPQGTGKLLYADMEAAMKLSIGDIDEIQNEGHKIDIYSGIHRSQNVENVLVTLINLGFLRGNCFPMLRICVVKRTNTITEILPPVQDRILASFALNSDDSWLDE